MMLLTKPIRAKLESNARAGYDSDGHPLASPPDFRPVVKLFNPCGGGTWLFTEIHEDDTLFGLCDLGMGSPELGYASLAEIQSVRLPFGLRIERDRHFTPNKTLSEYASEARNAGRIQA